MCFGAEAAWVPAAIAAAGAATSGVAQHQALKRQDNAVARGIAERAGIQREAGDRVNKTIQDVNASNPDMERKAAQDDFMAALRKSKTADGSLDIGGPAGASDRFASDVVSARATAGEEGKALAGNLARIDAPTFQRQREATGIANTGVELSLLGDNAQAADFLSQLRASRAGRADPLLSGLGQGLSAFGAASASATRPSMVSGTLPNGKSIPRRFPQTPKGG